MLSVLQPVSRRRSRRSLFRRRRATVIDLRGWNPARRRFRTAFRV
jgi:hypothetical protein